MHWGTPNVMFDSSPWLQTPFLMLYLAAYEVEEKKGELIDFHTLYYLKCPKKHNNKVNVFLSILDQIWLSILGA